ncbi:cobaltochelatase CobN [Pseudorhizobium tarimense]|uniref:Cobaltochelatase CobN n=1 Tax=Pseudorhizobium tarimense TaxID=1079109 RepID=A0ABV2H4S6_9HYPH|nr:cobaltochelatase subunit CobN [Pseudorhizobium tarimense]MCJ8518773.1 cobaltochelatase subunit CobN [Pseudorhizobium tarimense]
MHILATTSSSLDDLIEPVDLNQVPADVVVLSFSNSDLNSMSAHWPASGSASLSTANLSELRHPMSVDLWLEKTAAKAKLILVRILGGYDRWQYGVEQLAQLARSRKITLALLPGECSIRDDRLSAASTVDEDNLNAILTCFREGGRENMALLARRLDALARGLSVEHLPIQAMPKVGYYHPFKGVTSLEGLLEEAAPTAPRLPILFYRSMLLADDVAPIGALFEALGARGLAPVPIFIGSLKDKESLQFVEEVFAAVGPAAILSTTAFAAGADENQDTVFDRWGIPVFQVIIATTQHEAWAKNQRGLGPSDLAMHVVLPELDGRILLGAISFKQTDASSRVINQPQFDRIEQVAERVSLFLRMQQTPRAHRKVAILIPDYPNAPGRTGYAVGLDVPQSVLAMLKELDEAGYAVGDAPATPRELLDRLSQHEGSLETARYLEWLHGNPDAASAAVDATWGHAEQDPDVDQHAFRFRAATFGNITVALAPDRGRDADRRADYHDPALPPRHALLAFGLWLKERLGAHAVVHVGAHGTLEWLPGKTVSLSRECFPEIVLGGLPVIYPFIVSNPGEAAVAKRRIGAATIGHLPPSLVDAGLSEDQKRLELLVDEYAQADGLDRRRRDRLAKLIVETAQEVGLAGEAGVSREDDPDIALSRIDAFLCDLKDFAIKDGQHVYGVAAPDDTDPLRLASVTAERNALIAALDGRHIRPGPSGAPARGRLDVMPTGRNIYGSDPRTLPTPTAFDLGRKAADEVLRRYLQDHGDWPRSLVFDLWGSASLRSGGEEVAQVMALMGAKPAYDTTTGRVTGVEVMAPAQLGRPRVDVTLRISGLFRDMFPSLIALLDTAVRAIASREEAPGDNPLAEETRQHGRPPARIFGSAPGSYGAGIEDRLAEGSWQEREELGQAYLSATSHAFSGPEGSASEAHGQFAERIGDADLLVHTGDDPGRDLLDGSADVAFIGGFSAAIAAIGGKADLIVLDTTDPARPKARSISEAVTRVVRARATNPRFIAGQMRHGPRGAAELVEAVDRLIGFAETTQAIPQSLIEATYDAYVADSTVRDFLLSQNPEGARYMGERFRSALRRGLWHPRRNAVDEELEMLVAEKAA